MHFICSEVEYDTLGRWVNRLNDQASDGPKERLVVKWSSE